MTPPRTIGASDVPTILGLSPYADASPWALWARLCGHDVPSTPDTPAQARGRMMEPGILLRMQEETGILVTPNSERWYPTPAGTVCKPPGDAWCHATPDGLLWEHASDELYDYAPLAGAECKALRFLDGWGEHGTDQVRTDYAAQVTWQMACTGLPRVYVGAFGTYHDDWRMFVMNRDLELEAGIVSEVRAWWDRHVVGLTPPELDDTPAAARALSSVYGEVTRQEVQATIEDRELVRRLASVEAHLAEVKARRQRLRNEVQQRMGTATHLLHGSDAIARLTRPSRRDGSRRLTIIKEADA